MVYFQMIDMYYSRYGLSTNAQSIKWTACQRYDNFKRNIDHNRLQEQALTFGLELKNHLIVSVSEASIQNAVSFAFESVKEEIVKLEVALSRSFFECTDDFTLGQEIVREGSRKFLFLPEMGLLGSQANTKKSSIFQKNPTLEGDNF